MPGPLGPDVGTVGQRMGESVAGRDDRVLVEADPEAGAVAEDVRPGLDVQVEGETHWWPEVLEFADQVVGHRGRGVQQADRCGADGADGQVVGVREGGDP
jgi:hypothetical protein